jgi:hypothetical protein
MLDLKKEEFKSQGQIPLEDIISGIKLKNTKKVHKEVVS